VKYTTTAERSSGGAFVAPRTIAAPEASHSLKAAESAARYGGSGKGTARLLGPSGAFWRVFSFPYGSGKNRSRANGKHHLARESRHHLARESRHHLARHGERKQLGATGKREQLRRTGERKQLARAGKGEQLARPLKCKQLAPGS
jgi:hypothetical protein